MPNVIITISKAGAGASSITLAESHQEHLGIAEADPDEIAEAINASLRRTAADNAASATRQQVPIDWPEVQS